MRRAIRRLKGQTIVVTHSNGDLIQGVMVDEFSDCVKLRHPRNLSEGSDMKDPVYIPRERIDYYNEV